MLASDLSGDLRGSINSIKRNDAGDVTMVGWLADKEGYAVPLEVRGLHARWQNRVNPHSRRTCGRHSSTKSWVRRREERFLSDDLRLCAGRAAFCHRPWDKGAIHFVDCSPVSLNNPHQTGLQKPRKVAAKYREPNGQTWSGRGLKPLWLTSFERETYFTTRVACAVIKKQTNDWPGFTISHRQIWMSPASQPMTAPDGLGGCS